MAYGHDSADVMSVVGCTVGDAVLVELIAQGGMSCIYKAHHRGDLDTFYAVKCVPCDSHLPAEKEAFWAAVQREAGFLRLLSTHTRQVPQFIGAGRITSRTGATVGCIVMEFLEGRPLRDRIEEQGPHDLLDAIRLLEPIVEALGYAHRGLTRALGDRIVVHLDLKPENIFLKGTLEQPILIDLGVARRIAAHPAARSGKTTHAELAFTSLYGAPEQFDAVSFGPPSARTDVFALALVLVELVTGKVALLDQRYRDISGPDIRVRWTAYQAALNPERRPTILSLRGACDPRVDHVLARALAVKQEERFPDVTAFWLALCDSVGKDLSWGIKQLSSLPPPVAELPPAPQPPAPQPPTPHSPAPQPPTPRPSAPRFSSPDLSAPSPPAPPAPTPSTIPGEPLLPSTPVALAPPSTPAPPDRVSYGPGSTEPSDSFSSIPEAPRVSPPASRAPGAEETPGSRSLSGSLSYGSSGPSITAPPEVLDIPGERPSSPRLLLAAALGVALLSLGLLWGLSSGENPTLTAPPESPSTSAGRQVSAMPITAPPPRACAEGETLCPGLGCVADTDLHQGGCPPAVEPAVQCRGNHMTGRKQGNGRCERVSCDPGFGDCDPSREGCETATTSDSKNCGRCGNVCQFRPEAHVNQVRCAGATCQLASCEDGWMNCDGDYRACSFDLRSDVNHCGACNRSCQARNASASCASRTCQFTCNRGFACQDPQGNCKDTRSDVTCCGAAAAECRASNASARCDRGTCQFTCNPGFACQDPQGNCKDTRSDVSCCGSKAARCQAANASARCDGGACQFTCNPGFACQDGAGNCKDTRSDASCCGSSSQDCSRGVDLTTMEVSCSQGRCEARCRAPGAAECSVNGRRSCVDVQRDRSNCGLCGKVCTTTIQGGEATCQAGRCLEGCPPGKRTCFLDGRNVCMDACPQPIPPPTTTTQPPSPTRPPGTTQPPGPTPPTRPYSPYRRPPR